jgi:hypothetical protein
MSLHDVYVWILQAAVFTGVEHCVWDSNFTIGRAVARRCLTLDVHGISMHKDFLAAQRVAEVSSAVSCEAPK